MKTKPFPSRNERHHEATTTGVGATKLNSNTTNKTPKKYFYSSGTNNNNNNTDSPKTTFKTPKIMAGREIGVIPEEQTNSSDSIKNWLKSTFRGSKSREKRPSFEYEDGAINKHSTMPKNRMMRRSSSVGENIDKILQSELTWKKGKGRRPSLDRPTSSQSYTEI